MKNEMVRYVVVLGIITMLSSAALSFVYNVTKGAIADVDRQTLLAGLKNVLPEYDNDPLADSVNIDGYNVYIAKKGGHIEGYAVESVSSKGYGGDIAVLVGASPAGEIYNIEVIKHSETPGLGDNIQKSTFSALFKGSLLTRKLAVKADGGSIDQFSGATVSPRAVCDAVNLAAPVLIKASGGTE